MRILFVVVCHLNDLSSPHRRVNLAMSKRHVPMHAHTCTYTYTQILSDTELEEKWARELAESADAEAAHIEAALNAAALAAAKGNSSFR